KVYLKVLQKSMCGAVKLNEVMKELAADEDMKGKLKQAAKFTSKILQETGKIPEKRKAKLLQIGALNEKKVIEDGKDFLTDRVKARIIVSREDEKNRYDPKQKATLSIPCRPAIYIE
ncbi:hypothetical protein KAU92_04495, partial [Candidatus Bathyarchaeota archaeon]|nr:hypothetical protein [Candidatus Bathyarchaeota archaeon]